MRDTLIEAEYGEVEVEFSESGLPFLHLRCIKFSPRLYKQMLHDMGVILEAMADHGHPFVYSLIDKTELKTRKFQTMVGLVPCAIVGNNILHKIPTRLGE